MITASDSFSTIDLGNYYAILPGSGSLRRQYQAAGINAISVPKGFVLILEIILSFWMLINCVLLFASM